LKSKQVLVKPLPTSVMHTKKWTQKTRDFDLWLMTLTFKVGL